MKKNIKMIVRYLLTLLIFLSSLTSFAQQKISLVQAQELAFQYNKSIKNATLDVELAKKKVLETVSMGLPNVKGEVSGINNLELPTQLIPSSFFNSNASEDEFLELKFGTQYNATATLSASQLIFDGTYLVGVKASSIYKKLSQQSLELTTQQIQDSVSAAYYTILVNKERERFLKTIVDVHKDVLNEISAKYEQGFVEDLDVDRMTLLLSSFDTQYENMRLVSDLSELYFKLIVGISLDDEILLTDSLTGFLKNNSNFKLEQPMIEKRLEYQLALTQLELNKLDLKRHQASRLPMIVAFGTYSKNAMRNEFDFIDEVGNWYPSKVVGVKATMNLFGGFSTYAKIQQAKINFEKSKNEKHNIDQALILSYKVAESNYLRAHREQENKSTSLNISERIYIKTLAKFREGLVSSIELSQSGADYMEAHKDNVESIYNLLIAKMNYHRTIGK